MDQIELRNKMETISSSYPEIKAILYAMLDTVGKPINIPVDPSFLKELIDLKGIGKKTAEDITKLYQKRDFLINDLKVGKVLPFREDINKILKDKYSI
jgi:hypothetical protein